MIFLVESIILCLLFTAIVVPSVIKNPLVWISDYPPAIQKRVKELGLVPIEQKRMPIAIVIRKAIASFLVVMILTVILVYINGVETFVEGFLLSYGLWTVVAWYDAFVLDCIWFCHSKKAVIAGTEKLEKSYHDYWFHIKRSMVGMLFGLPVSLLTGLAVVVLA